LQITFIHVYASGLYHAVKPVFTGFAAYYDMDPQVINAKTLRYMGLIKPGVKFVTHNQTFHPRKHKAVCDSFLVSIPVAEGTKIA
jgi:hypothetical protein